MSKETEVKKDIEWLRNEVNKLPLRLLGFSILKQREEYAVNKDDVLGLINQLDEPEQKYIVSDNSSIPLLIKNDSGEIMSYDSQIAYNNSNGTIELTEQEIKDYDERYWPFAVKVEELEE